MCELKLDMSEKKPRGSPTGDTPRQKDKRREVQAQASRKKLSFNVSKWSDLECSALVEFVIHKKGGHSWPFGKETQFWDSAAEYVKQRTESEILRSG